MIPTIDLTLDPYTGGIPDRGDLDNFESDVDTSLTFQTILPIQINNFIIAANTTITSMNTVVDDVNEAATTATEQAAIATTAAATATAAATEFTATSSTSTLIETGSKTFAIETGKSFVVGQYVRVVSEADIANYMSGQISAASDGSITVDVINIGGAGTFSDWSIAIANIGPDNLKTVGGQSIVGAGNVEAGTVLTGVSKGAISKGNLVALNSDGSFSALDITTPSILDSGVFNAGTIYSIDVCEISDNKILISYRDTADSNKGKCIVADISVGIPTFGSVYEFYSGASFGSLSVKLEDNKALLMYYDGTNTSAKAIVVNVTEKVPTFGTPYEFDATGFNNPSAVAIDATKVAVSYAPSTAVTAKMLGITGNTVSNYFSTTTGHIPSSSQNYSAVEKISDTEVLFIYRYSNTELRGKVLTDSGGANWSVGSEDALASISNISNIALSRVNDSNYVFATGISTTSSNIGLINVSESNDITTSNIQTLNAAHTRNININYIDDLNSVVCYGNQGGSNVEFFTVNTDTTNNVLSLGVKSVLDTDNIGIYVSSKKLSDGSVFIGYSDNTGGYEGEYGVVTPEYNNSFNYIGVAGVDSVDEQEATVKTIGAKADGFTGLTIGSKYYLNLVDQTISVGSSGLEIGKAVSSDAMILTGVGV